MELSERFREPSVLLQRFPFSLAVKSQVRFSQLLPVLLQRLDDLQQRLHVLRVFLPQRAKDVLLLRVKVLFPLFRLLEKRIRISGPAVNTEDLFQNALLFVGGSSQKPLELTLGQQHDLAELLLGQADQLLGLALQVGDFGVFKKRDQIAVIVQLPGLQRQRKARPFWNEAPCEPVLSSPDRKGKRNDGLVLPRRLGAAPFLQVVSAVPDSGRLPAAAPVQSKRHGVEDRGLSAAGIALDEKDPAPGKLFKIDRLFFHVGAEGLDFQFQRSHFRTSSTARTASVNMAISRSSGCRSSSSLQK